MKVLLISGYRRTGKDSLCNLLSGVEVPSRFVWRVYRNPFYEIQHSCIFSTEEIHYQRTAFADALKSEASVEYGIPSVVPDSDKDVKQFIHYKTGAMVSARDIYIEWGAVRRSQDPDYWCKAAFKCIDDKDNVACVVTDWRFRNEAGYIIRNFPETVTIRVYRSDVPEPDLNIESEHDLDFSETDLLLLRDDLEGEFEKTVTRFPQYHEYVACGTV